MTQKQADGSGGDSVAKFRQKMADGQRLQEKFLEVKKKLDIRDDLTLAWMPGGSTELQGEIRDKTVYVYDKEYDDAVGTLKHELIEYLVAKTQVPYRELLKKLMEYFNTKAYMEREKVVEQIRGALDDYLLARLSADKSA